MRIINVLVFLFAIMALVQTLRLFGRNRTSIRSTAIFIVLWAAIGIFGLYPNLLDLLMGWTMMKDRMIFLFMISILILYAMLFRQSTDNFQLNQTVNRLVQEIASLKYQLEHQNVSDDQDNCDIESSE